MIYSLTDWTIRTRSADMDIDLPLYIEGCILLGVFVLYVILWFLQWDDAREIVGYVFVLFMFSYLALFVLSGAYRATTYMP